MANRYWVSGGTGSWSNTSNWSATSGGARGASAPTSLTGDFVYFDANSGTGVSVLAATVTIVGLDCTGFSGTLSIPSGTSLNVAGNVTLSVTATYTGAGTFTISIPVATTRTLTTNNAILQYTLVNFNGSAQATAIVTLVGALNITQQFRASGCTLNLNSYVVTCGLLRPTGSVTFAFGSSGTSAIVIPTGGGANNTSVVDLSLGSGYTSTFSGTQRPTLRLTYAGSVGSRKVVDGYNLFDYIWFGSDLSNSLALSCINLNLSNFSGSILMASAISVSGDLTFNTATNWLASGSYGITFNGNGTQNIDTKGIGLDCAVNFGSATTTGAYVIQNNITLGGTSRTTTLASGTLNLNGKTVTVFNFNSSNTATRNITFASGKIIVGGTASAWIATTGTNLSITGPGSIELTNVTNTRIFDGGSVVYSGVTLLLSGLSTSSIIRGSNSFFSIRNTVSPQTIYFTPSTTTIFTDNFELNGTAGNNITITAAPAPSGQVTGPNFAKPSGTIVCSYANIIWSNAGYTGNPPGTGPTAAYTSTWTTGVGTVLTPNQTSGWTKSAGTSGFITFFYP